MEGRETFNTQPATMSAERYLVFKTMAEKMIASLNGRQKREKGAPQDGYPFFARLDEDEVFFVKWDKEHGYYVI